MLFTQNNIYKYMKYILTIIVVIPIYIITMPQLLLKLRFRFIQNLLSFLPEQLHQLVPSLTRQQSVASPLFQNLHAIYQIPP